MFSWIQDLFGAKDPSDFTSIKKENQSAVLRQYTEEKLWQYGANLLLDIS